MISNASSPDEYIAALPDERKVPMQLLRDAILKTLPKGFEEKIIYGMVGYVVPHSIYPPGYHCDPKLPLSLFSMASQKNYIALHHMGLYADAKLLEWFTTEYPKHCKTKLDMGKGCVRFKKMDQIPYELVSQLVSKLTPEEWIIKYESAFKR